MDSAGTGRAAASREVDSEQGGLPPLKEHVDSKDNARPEASLEVDNGQGGLSSLKEHLERFYKPYLTNVGGYSADGEGNEEIADIDY